MPSSRSIALGRQKQLDQYGYSSLLEHPPTGGFNRSAASPRCFSLASRGASRRSSGFVSRSRSHEMTVSSRPASISNSRAAWSSAAKSFLAASILASQSAIVAAISSRLRRRAQTMYISQDQNIIGTLSRAIRNSRRQPCRLSRRRGSVNTISRALKIAPKPVGRIPSPKGDPLGCWSLRRYELEVALAI